jgi:uncharacterized protein YndB with AHSA1/START domain
MQTSIDINASPQAVWDIVTDLDRMGEWVTIHGPAGSTARTSYKLTDHEGGSRFGYGDGELRTLPVTALGRFARASVRCRRRPRGARR